MDVEHDRVRPSLAGDLQPIRGRFGGDDLDVAAAEDTAKGGQDVGFVIDDQQSRHVISRAREPRLLFPSPSRENG
jgi:hypothetical protein